MKQNQQEYIKSVALPIGTSVGSVVIRKLIGAGSNAIVYEASDAATQRVVVVKEYFPILLARRKPDSSVCAKSEDLTSEFDSGLHTFLENGIKLSHIRHPNVLQILKVEEQNNTVYRLTEKVTGQSLSEIVTTQSFVPPETKSLWIKKILDALKCIHEDNLLHLAIEPGNVIINEKLEPILIDFGNSHAQLSSHSTEKDNPYRAIEITNNNQAEIGNHTDIYAAGALFVHLLSGTPPIPSSARAKSNTDPQIALVANKELRKYYKKGELAAIDRAIAISPKNRFASIEEWLDETSQSKEKSDNLRKKLTFGSVGIVLAAVIFWLAQGRDMYVEYQTWNAVDQSDPCNSQTYIDQYPEGRYAEKAQALKDTCEKEAARLQQQQIAQLVGPMVTVAGGCFEMGSPQNEVDRAPDERLHAVCVNDVNIAIHEVTIDKFKAFVKDTSYQTDAEEAKDNPGCWALSPEDEEPWGYKAWASWRQPYKELSIKGDHPVSCVSAHDIDQYLSWLNSKTGVTFRLPTEAEWEYAAQGKNAWARPWGEDMDSACQYANIADTTNDTSITGISGNESPWPDSHACDDGSLFANSVGRYQPNHNGLYDLIGNVWEITCSKYSGAYGGSELECSSGQDTRTDKGGGWQSGPREARSAARGDLKYSDRGSNIGFRLVLDGST